jgi:DNA-binding response OmpR family regulator
MNRKGHILVVETDKLIRELLERWLGEAGYFVVVGGVVPPLGGGAPMLIIANVSSPRAAQELIRSLRAAYAAPILALSARFRRGLGASREAARQLGVRKVLPKPFTRDELLAAVRESLDS